eukprot:GFUD01064251.1.p1 GENE.GFUD01064251.1~~GFUD01064251.1.p1  ORF type:complete len:295 (-),score=74.58 GFUD01064251.1:3-812(-)
MGLSVYVLYRDKAVDTNLDSNDTITEHVISNDINAKPMVGTEIVTKYVVSNDTPVKHLVKNDSLSENVVGNDILASDNIVIKSCAYPEEQDQKRWSVLKSVISSFSSLSAPYLLSDGSLLHLYRNCSVGLSDLDFSLDQAWWEDNKEELKEELSIAGFKLTAVFGNMNMFGYEESWQKNGVKVDIFGSNMEGNSRVTGFWVQGKNYPCTMPMERTVMYQWRGEVEVRIPFPVEDALIAMYGRNYPHPVGQWQWDIYPFLTGYCSYQYIA